jgi:hypothetical protein
MKAVDFLIVIVLCMLLITGLYLLWLNLPQQQVEYQRYQAVMAQNLSLKSSQFYPDMRYPDKEITFHLSDTCSNKKKNDFRDAITILEQRTILSFLETNDAKAQITITCSNLAPKPDQEGHFIAGEGGPALFLNTSKYAIIISGEIALYRPETCEIPQIALHELLHALGFDHNSNPESIMFPITDCKQTLDPGIVNEINRLYAQPSLPDASVESIEANQTGRYLNFEIVIANYGLKTLNASTLEITTNNQKVKDFEIGEVEVGARRHLTVTNLYLPRNANRITFAVQTPQAEITKDNNIVEIVPNV